MAKTLGIVVLVFVIRNIEMIARKFGHEVNIETTFLEGHARSVAENPNVACNLNLAYQGCEPPLPCYASI